MEPSCPKCGSNHIHFIVPILVSAPFDYYPSLSKQSLRDRAVTVVGVNWSDRELFCLDCGWSSKLGDSADENN